MVTRTDAWIKPRDGETEQSALKRRVKMHEFLMTGGIQIGLNSAQIMEYTGPIDDPVAYGPACPWHGEGCSAWAVIFAGDNDGTGTRNESGFTLAELREKYPNIARVEREEAKDESSEDAEIETPMALSGNDRVGQKIDSAAQYAPNTVALDDNNTFVASTALCAAHWSRETADGLAKAAGLARDPLWGKAPKSRYGCVLCMEFGEPEQPATAVSGNPWDRGRVAGSPAPLLNDYESHGSYPRGGFRRRPRLEDSRDTAVRAFDNIEEPDEIVIEGDEDE